ncbi:HEAT repeat domain-containing protein [Planktothrix agardhii]|jgi:FOG: HEAT repeat|uniref:CpeF n=1 Tax=Planktothrix agardhii TaxID=1160 RepID=A0AAD1Q550_PLAAG|nr:HEAT repeat domain-containing protein [Planktothrix agardhii]MCB8764503.1 HEAT repeat domain-containing protein [Planktothrix agardhii 1809]MCB8766185.1 HEAT repeat domain-containing protein [Planktothrix agardhii 1809]MCB8782562.1 HEAT repeat domain-containing protein [Planktothrix agardhii 1808]MCF3566407.1 HEAT repeat domain-containing protein [Planktothrix agardhii 1807]MCF3589589.1 HEAT repeat domain-containing protein [Planktothrix agardhii 1029]
MAPFYRLTLFLLVYIASWGGTSYFSSRTMAAVANKTEPLTHTSDRSSTNPLGSSDLSWQLAQTNPEKPPTPDAKTPPPPKKSGFRLPSKTLILGVGALIITVGAILILIRLISSSDPEEGKVIDIQAQTLPKSHPEPSPSVKEQPQTAPTVIQPGQPSVFSEVNSHPEATLQISKTDTPRSEYPASSSLIDAPYPAKLDPQEQWINDLKQTNPNIRNNAIWELAQAGDSRAIQALLELLINSDSNQRSLVLAALSEIGTRTLKPLNRALSLSLQDENAEVRKNAIRDLTRIYDLVTQMSQILQRAIDDPDPEVQEMAKWATDRLSRLRSTNSRDEPLG